MTFQQLLFALEVAECASISKAANNLYTHQSNVSIAIKQLEEEFGVQLFQRTKKGVLVTSEGEEFLAYAKEIIRQKKFMENLYAVRIGQQYNHLRVSSMRAFFLIEFMHRVQNKLPGEIVDNYYFRLIRHPFDRVLEDVASNQAEIGIVFVPETKRRQMGKLASVKNLDYYELGESRLHLAVRKGHPILKESSLEKLIDYPYVVSEEEEQYGQFFDEHFDAITELLKNKPQRVISTNDGFTSESIVSRTNAFHISAVPHQRNKQQNCMSIEIPGNKAKLIFYYVVRKNYNPSNLAKMFIKELEGMFSDIDFISSETQEQ